MPQKIDLTGKKFGRWLVKSENPIRRNGKVLWDCVCECGNNGTVFSSNLIRGISKSCGCLDSEMTAKRNFKHGLVKHPLHLVWKNMIRRCTNPKDREYHNYGGRGISVCKEWMQLKNFYNDMIYGYKKGLSIDRINVNGNYEKSNCKWSTSKEQGVNRRNNRIITVNGVSKTVTEFADEMKVSPYLIFCRLRYGWSEEEAVLTNKLTKWSTSKRKKIEL